MFNVAIVNIKDILKYLVSITITLCLVMFVTRYFSNLKEEKTYQLEIMQTSLLFCLDETIPAIKETNNELNNTDEEKINKNNILGNLLRIELAMFKEEKKTADIQSNASNQTQKLESINIENPTQENLDTELTRKYYYTSCNRKSISWQL